ncbi:unnamed protein product [Durusdinium trenchii]|uniref:Bestrophin homolog n=1 Tax=Durusdinium trenchii TaxID=1381693 RepID=A0ABP0IW02_9DINO
MGVSHRIFAIARRAPRRSFGALGPHGLRAGFSSRPAHWDEDPDCLLATQKPGQVDLTHWIHSVLGKPLQRSDAEQARQRFWLTREQRCQGHNTMPDDSWWTLLQSIVARRAPVKATAAFLLYCSGITLAFENLRNFSTTGQPVVVDEVTHVVQYVMASHDVMQTCTGFIATALFMTLSFRMNRAASRWWHGREMCAQLLSNARNFKHVTSVSVTDKALAVELSMLGYAFVRAAEFHMRLDRRLGRWNTVVPMFWEPAESKEPDERYTEAFRPLLPPATLKELLAAPHRPYFLAQRINKRIADTYDAGATKNVRLVVAMQNQINNLVQTIEGIECIRSTPEPWSYQKHNVLLMKLWLSILPVALVPTLHFATPLLGGSIGYVVYKLDDVAAEICNPFGVDESDISLCVMIDRFQLELLAALLAEVKYQPCHTAVMPELCADDMPEECSEQP